MRATPASPRWSDGRRDRWEPVANCWNVRLIRVLRAAGRLIIPTFVSTRRPSPRSRGGSSTSPTGTRSTGSITSDRSSATSGILFRMATQAVQSTTWSRANVRLPRRYDSSTTSRWTRCERHTSGSTGPLVGCSQFSSISSCTTAPRSRSSAISIATVRNRARSRTTAFSYPRRRGALRLQVALVEATLWSWRRGARWAYRLRISHRWPRDCGPASSRSTAGEHPLATRPCFSVAYFTTVRADGSPRLHPFCPISRPGSCSPRFLRRRPRGGTFGASRDASSMPCPVPMTTNSVFALVRSRSTARRDPRRCVGGRHPQPRRRHDRVCESRSDLRVRHRPRRCRSVGAHRAAGHLHAADSAGLPSSARPICARLGRPPPAAVCPSVR